MARRHRAAGPVRAEHPFLGDLRAAGQHARPVGRRQYGPCDRPVRFRHPDPDDMVLGVQPVHDLRLHAIRGGVMGVAGCPRRRTVEHHKDGARLPRRHGGEPDHGGRGALRRRRQGELAVAIVLFRRDYGRRALSVADRVVAGDQGRAPAHSLDDDGRVAGDELRRRLSRRLSRQFLEPDGEAGVFSDDRRHCGGRRRGDLRLPLAAQRDAAGVTENPP